MRKFLKRLIKLNRVLVFLLLLYALMSRVPIFHFQADAETDEVYAQMTLQPLNSVCDFSSMFIYICFILSFNFYIPHNHPNYVGRAKGTISSSWLGFSQQTADQLFLQNIDRKRHKYSWWFFSPSSCSRKSFPPTGAVFGFFSLYLCSYFVWLRLPFISAL